MFRRYLQLLRLFLLRDGGKRAAYCKKTGYFHAQGEGCYFQIYNFGVEPHLLSFGSNIKVASGVRFITHDIFGDVILYKNNMAIMLSSLLVAVLLKMFLQIPLWAAFLQK